jgi:hypothetical protein
MSPVTRYSPLRPNQFSHLSKRRIAISRARLTVTGVLYMCSQTLGAAVAGAVLIYVWGPEKAARYGNIILNTIDSSPPQLLGTSSLPSTLSLTRGCKQHPRRRLLLLTLPNHRPSLPQRSLRLLRPPLPRIRRGPRSPTGRLFRPPTGSLARRIFAGPHHVCEQRHRGGLRRRTAESGEVFCRWYCEEGLVVLVLAHPPPPFSVPSVCMCVCC